MEYSHKQIHSLSTIKQEIKLHGDRRREWIETKLDIDDMEKDSEGKKGAMFQHYKKN